MNVTNEASTKQCLPEAVSAAEVTAAALSGPAHNATQVADRCLNSVASQGASNTSDPPVPGQEVSRSAAHQVLPQSLACQSYGTSSAGGPLMLSIENPEHSAVDSDPPDAGSWA